MSIILDWPLYVFVSQHPMHADVFGNFLSEWLCLPAIDLPLPSSVDEFVL